MMYTPTSITVDRTRQELLITWKDAHTSIYPLDSLRRACPCAACSGGHDNMGTLPDPSLFSEPPRQQWLEVTIRPVGTYAIQITWDDGHDAGIHTWERLRAICPCTACRP